MNGISFSLGAKSAGPAATKVDHTTNGTTKHATNGKKRSHASLGDDSDDEATPAKQVVTHFGSKGAVNAAAPKVDKGPLVIKAQANRDWKEAAAANKRVKYGIPQDAKQEAKNREEAIKKIEDSKKPTWGLNVKNKENGEGSAKEQDEAGLAETNGANGVNGHAEAEAEVTRKPKTDDERAMDALLGLKQSSDAVISAVSEQEAFDKDFRKAPPQASLDEYAAMPVEEFGAALLRGMGWKEGNGIGNQKGVKSQRAKMPERRPALLGIGAKEDAAVKEEIGAWGRGAKRKTDQGYNAVFMRNLQTCEQLTEEQVKARMEDQQAKDREAELEAVHKARRREARDKEREKGDRRRTAEESDGEYERRRREKRRERERDRDGRDDDRRERRRSKDREDRHRRDRDDRRDDRKDGERRRDRDDHDKHRRRDERDYDDERRRRHR